MYLCPHILSASITNDSDRTSHRVNISTSPHLLFCIAFLPTNCPPTYHQQQKNLTKIALKMKSWKRIPCEIFIHWFISLVFCTPLQKMWLRWQGKSILVWGDPVETHSHLQFAARLNIHRISFWIKVKPVHHIALLTLTRTLYIRVSYEDKNFPDCLE